MANLRQKRTDARLIELMNALDEANRRVERLERENTKLRSIAAAAAAFIAAHEAAANDYHSEVRTESECALNKLINLIGALELSRYSGE